MYRWKIIAYTRLVISCMASFFRSKQKCLLNSNMMWGGDSALKCSIEWDSLFRRFHINLAEFFYGSCVITLVMNLVENVHYLHRFRPKDVVRKFRCRYAHPHYSTKNGSTTGSGVNLLNFMLNTVIMFIFFLHFPRHCRSERPIMMINGIISFVGSLWHGLTKINNVRRCVTVLWNWELPRKRGRLMFILNMLGH